MAVRKTRKDFLSMKDFEQSFQQWLMDHGWSLTIDWRDQEHKSCSRRPTGNWKLQGYGHYEAADWHWKNYASFRCTKCGIMVQFNQNYAEEDQDAQPVTRMVIVP